MNNIKITEMIITCESCGNVKKFQVTSESDCNKIFKDFKCENNCGRSFYSYITLGSVDRDEVVMPKLNLQLAIAK